ncbi:MAG: DNA-packaging protein [Acidiferrobacterales bacterium]|nr:DNA-packaging protein [Acidiferrobacterales bacterium]
MANPVGRPTDYSKELQAAADDYIYTWMDTDKLPSRVGLCSRIGISKTVSYDWEKKYDEFLNTLKVIETLQEYSALNKGITGEFNSTIVKLVLANHGYSEKSSVDHTTNGEKLSAPVYHVVEE